MTFPVVPVLNAHPTRKTGARPPKRAPMLRYAAIRSGAGLTSPFDADYLRPLNAQWQMLGNDLAGDCVAVRWANDRFLVTSSLTDAPHYASQDDVWAIYRTQNPGFVPGAGPHGYGSKDDAGMDSQTLAEYLHKTGGPDGVKLVAFASIDPVNVEHVQEAIDIFGRVWIDIIVLDGNQTQFDQGKPWTDVGGNIDGGHAVLGGGVVVSPASATDPLIPIETWAAETALSRSFWDGKAQGYQLVQQVIVPIWPENIGTRQFHQGVDLAALEAEYQAVTGKTLVLPDPTPSPQPGPSGEVVTFTAARFTACDAAAKRVRPWWPKYAKNAAQAWKDSTS